MDSSLEVLPGFLVLSLVSVISCSYVPLSFRTEPLSTVQRLGGAVALRCASQPGSARVRWLWEGRPLDPQALPPGLQLVPGSLSIPSLQPRHAGRYQCVAQTDTGAIVSRHAHVTIADLSDFLALQRRAVKAEEGGTALIECRLPPSTPPALPRFRVRGQWLEQSADQYLILPSGNLQILSVAPRHQGTYKCGAYNPITLETRVEPHGQKLTVKRSDGPSPVRILYPTSPQTLTVAQSESLTLECVLAGSPAPTTHWTKDGQDVVPGPNRRMVLNNLQLDGVRRVDGGSYRCSAKTETGGVVSANYTVNVLEPASVSRELLDQSVSLHSSIRFTCVAKGSPAPNVTWLFNAAPLAPSPRLQLSGSSLLISAVTSQDQGMYQCLVDNGIGSAQSAGRLTIQSVGSSTVSVTAGPPPSVDPVQSDEGAGGGGVPSTDRASDAPTPEAPIITSPPQTHKPDMYDLEWRPGRDWGSPIVAYFVKYRKLDELGSILGGWHTVRVPGSEKALRLAELEASSLYEVLMVARSSAGEGQPAMLTFRTGKEKATSSNKSPHPQGPAVPVGKPEKAPVFEGLNTHYGVVVHDRVPEAPDRPTISMATESSVYVTWIPRANGGSPITAFRVEYRRQGRSAEWIVAADNISPLKLSVEVRSLEPGSTYRFRVIAINMYGESPHSAPSRPYHVSTVSTHFTSRPIAGPHISSTDAVSDTQIILRWTYTPSSNNNTPIQGFYIYYRPTDSDNDSDYKRDVVEGSKQWHMIGQLQPETSYDIKMQCFNDGGESEYSNVMICETKARQPPGVPPLMGGGAVTPPGPGRGGAAGGTALQRGGDMLYLIVGSVLGVMVLILLGFIAMCLWRNRQQNSLHKYDPPGYLYQPAEMNGHVLEYTTLPGTNRVNGGLHPGYGHSAGLPPGCPHLHHKLPNGTGSLCPSAHDSPPPHSPSLDYEHSHHLHNGGGVYTALPQSDPSDCMSCQNFCNNNRCYSKTNGTFPSGTLPMMHRMGPCQQDGLEMVPLGHGTPPCHTPTAPQCTEQEGEEPRECVTLPTSQHSCCQAGEYGLCLSEERGEEPRCQDPEGPVVVCWESLGLPALDCTQKSGWISSGTALDSPGGDFAQPQLQET
ncbi:cell adhesion molecule-related/down-regulated by oncogenes isoform X2 [Amia ocellicauda]|uniref:cell adhesion molecule-related/down-regulated by oncogenes isoform X2 n=1 Tax=Amia ocellicauda TaxID=2972642 RepID=UPI003464900A